MKGKFACLVAVVTTSLGQAAEPVTKAPRLRLEFAAAMNKIKEGMSKAEVERLLGKPDDYRRKDDAGGISAVGIQVIWRYGASGHLKPATLGQILFDDGDRVRYLVGHGEPDLKQLPAENELRRMLEALGQLPSYSSSGSFDPRKLILAVNLLQPLGKEKALAVIDEFMRVSSHWDDSEAREGVFLLLRTLFEAPEGSGQMPRMGVGLLDPEHMKRFKSALPLFPIALEQDIPFLVGGMPVYLSGIPEQPESHIEYFRKSGKIRAKPLMPSSNPAKALQEFAKSTRWPFIAGGGIAYDESRGQHHLCEQLLRLVDSVFRIEPDWQGSLIPWGDQQEATQQKIMKDVSKLKLRWDSVQNKYTFLDGSSLPEREVKHYRILEWEPGFPGCDLKILFERVNRRGLVVCLSVDYEIGKPLEPAEFKVFKVGAHDKPVVEFSTREVNRFMRSASIDSESKTPSTACFGMSKQFELVEGTEVVVEMEFKKKVKRSPAYKP